MLKPSSNQPTLTNRTAALAYAALILLLLLLVVSLYTLLHEGGHALAGVLFGGRLTAFSVNFFDLSAHASLDGAFTTFQRAAISAAGVGLPLLACMALVLLAPRRVETLLGWFRLLFFMGAVNALLAWIVIPVLVLLGNTVSDDSASFISITGLPPLLVSGAALLVYLACWLVFLRRTGGFRAAAELVRSPAFDLRSPQTRKSLGGLAAAGAVTGALILAMTLAFPDQSYQAPAGYQKVAELQFSSQPVKDEAIYRFTLAQPGSVSFFFSLSGIQGGPIQIRLTGPDGYENVFFYILDSQAKIGQGSVHPQNIPLKAGEYQVVVTFLSTQGRMRVYVK